MNPIQIKPRQHYYTVIAQSMRDDKGEPFEPDAEGNLQLVPHYCDPNVMQMVIIELLMEIRDLNVAGAMASGALGPQTANGLLAARGLK